MPPESTEYGRLDLLPQSTMHHRKRCSNKLNSTNGAKRPHPRVLRAHESKARGQSLCIIRSSYFEWSGRSRTNAAHWLGGQAKSDCYSRRIAATDRDRNLGRAPARMELLLSEVEGWRHSQSSHEADFETAST